MHEGSDKLIKMPDEADQKDGPAKSSGSIASADTVGIYFRQMAHVPLLTPEEEVELAKQMERGRDAEQQLSADGHSSNRAAELERLIVQAQAARRHLIRANTRLVVSVAKKYIGLGLPFPDLIQAGNVGLIRAVDRFDYRRGTRVSTYATWWIRQSILRTLQQQRRLIRLPAHMGERVRKFLKMEHSLEQELGHRPTSDEIAREADSTAKQVQWLKRISRPTLSLEMPVGTEGDSHLGDFVKDKRSRSPSQRAEEHLLREEIAQMLNKLSSREARVIRLRFGLDGNHPYSLRELGEKMGVSKERVRQIQGRALRKLRHPLLWHRLKHWLK